MESDQFRYQLGDMVEFRLRSDGIPRFGNITMASAEIYLIWEGDGEDGEIHRVLPEEIVCLEYRASEGDIR